MGFFSSLCSKSKISIPALPHAELPPEASHVVVVLPDSSTFTGHYDGYGRVIDENEATLDLNALAEKFSKEHNLDYFDAFYACHRMVRADHYDNDRFEDLAPNEDCPDQGYFYEDETRDAIIESLKTTPDHEA